MKKVLTVLTLITLLGVSAPAFAAPAPPPARYDGQVIHAGFKPDMRRPYNYHYGYYRPHSSFAVYTNYSHRLAFPYCRCPYCMAHRPHTGVGLYLSF